MTDVLGLGRCLDELFLATSARRRQASVVFVDARELPGAYQLAGLYRIDGEQVNVSVRLARAKEKGVRFSITGDRAKVPELAAKVYQEAEKRLGSQESPP